MWAGWAGVDPPLKKLIHFFLGPWLLVCQFIEMELTGETLCGTLFMPIHFMKNITLKLNRTNPTACSIHNINIGKKLRGISTLTRK